VPASSSSLMSPALEQLADLPGGDRGLLAGGYPSLAGYEAHYILVVKKNQPGLYAQVKNLPWRQVPPGARQHDRGHGREERRTLKVTAVAAGLMFPHAAQAIAITRRTRALWGGKWRTVTVCGITSLTAAQASPAGLAGWIRGHWRIEALHHIRSPGTGLAVASCGAGATRVSFSC
jgi:hypothetical protein